MSFGSFFAVWWLNGGGWAASVASPCQMAQLKKCGEGVAFPCHRSFMIFLKILDF